MSQEEDEADIDYYDLLGVPQDSTNEVIDKAYRRKARKYHPDKNRDNPEAATKVFHQISKAYEILTNPQKRLVYDNARKARSALKVRHEALDAKRKAMKADLEDRENAARLEKRKKTAAEESRQAKKRQHEDVREWEENKEISHSGK
ncbi:1426_t:CDS:2 [Paraglomus occultum]|uniref:1426_t:CDS:1 n=1 Tax=Paraglomus occultum TaxID=144539 RepID=A0A9N9FZN3_9GLOM|nr:1426_t:CDS:2 [Paraglomus occultum]